ncbi:hypothetical protein ABZS54_08415, partial [Embleya sp. NPDC005575]
ARRVARAQRTELTGCRLTEGYADVEVTAPAPAGTAHATARAGPVDPMITSSEPTPGASAPPTPGRPARPQQGVQ